MLRTLARLRGSALRGRALGRVLFIAMLAIALGFAAPEKIDSAKADLLKPVDTFSLKLYLYNQTPNLKELSKILGVCEFSVWRILRRFEIKYSRKKTFEKYLETDIEKEKVYQLYKELKEKYKKEWVLKEISERFKVSRAEVLRCLKSMGTI